jgi:hypothetical protein
MIDPELRLRTVRTAGESYYCSRRICYCLQGASEREVCSTSRTRPVRGGTPSSGESASEELSQGGQSRAKHNTGGSKLAQTICWAGARVRSDLSTFARGEDSSREVRGTRRELSCPSRSSPVDLNSTWILLVHKCIQTSSLQSTRYHRSPLAPTIQACFALAVTSRFRRRAPHAPADLARVLCPQPRPSPSRSTTRNAPTGLESSSVSAGATETTRRRPSRVGHPACGTASCPCRRTRWVSSNRTRRRSMSRSR